MKSDKIYIFDTTLRDGEQVPGCKLNTKEKLELALELEQSGGRYYRSRFPGFKSGGFSFRGGNFKSGKACQCLCTEPCSKGRY